MPLPHSWIECKLLDIGIITSGGTPSTKDEANFGGDIPWITPADLSEYNSKYIVCGKRNITEKGLQNSSAVLIPEGSVLFSSRAPIGYVVIAANSLATNQGFKNVIPSKYINSEYLYQYLRICKQKAEKTASGTTFKEISAEKFGNLPFPLPPLPEQHRIVAKIDSLFSELDNGVALLKTIKAQLVIYRQAVLKWAFEGKLTNSTIIKEEKLGKFIENPRYGTSKKCSHENSGTKVYRIPNINYREGTILQDDLKYAVFSENEEEALRLKKDDILIIRSNGSVNLVGRASIVADVDTDGIFAGYLMRLRIIADVLVPKFLLFYLSSFNARSYIETTAKSTSGVNNINSDEICKLKFPYFDKPEQLTIVSAIESRLSVCDELEQTIDQTLALSVSLRQSILKKAFEGRLVPQDPNDEPAERLLERIKTEKAAVLAKQKQTRKRGRK